MYCVTDEEVIEAVIEEKVSIYKEENDVPSGEGGVVQLIDSKGTVSYITAMKYDIILDML